MIINNQMQLLALNEIADVSIGLTMRGTDASRRVVGEGELLLRISDLTEDGKICIAKPTYVSAEGVSLEKYRVQAGDILVANRGSRMTAAIAPPDLKAVAGGQLFMVRLKSGRVIAEYLHWYLNLPKTQELLLSRTRGSYVKTLSIRVLKEDLKIPVPSLETQRKVIELASLAARERELVSLIAEKRQQFLDVAMEKMVTEVSN